MYEFVQIEAGWQVYWGPPQPPVPVVASTAAPEETPRGEALTEVIVRRRAADRRAARRDYARRRGLLAVR
jgi:hypothetical protein